MDPHSTFLCDTHLRICYFQVEKYLITLILVQGLWLNALEKWPNSFDHCLPVYQWQTHKRFMKALTTSNHISKTVSTSKLSNNDFIVSSTPVLETNALVCPFTSDISVSYSLSSSFIISYSGHRLLLATVCKWNFSQKSNLLNHNDDTFHWAQASQLNTDWGMDIQAHRNLGHKNLLAQVWLTSELVFSTIKLGLVSELCHLTQQSNVSGIP